MRARFLLPVCSFAAFYLSSVPVVRAAESFNEAEAQAFTDRYCSSCHNDVDKEGGLDLTSLKFEPADSANFLTWVKVHDRVQAGEMPPKEKKRPATGELTGFVKGLSTTLIATEREQIARTGRATRRRLNRGEYEYALRDLLSAPWLQIKDQLPEDGEAFRFNKVSNALDVSYVHMMRYMSAADYAMRQAMTVKYVQPPTTTKRYYAREDGSIARWMGRQRGNVTPERNTFPVLGTEPQPDVWSSREPMTVGDADPAKREQEAVGWVSSNYITGFGSSWSSFHAPVAGKYRLRFSGYTLWVGGYGFWRYTYGVPNNGMINGVPQWYTPNFEDVTPGRRNEPITIYSKGGTINRRLGEFDLTPEPTVRELPPVWLTANEYIVTDAVRFFRSRPTINSTLISAQGGYTNPLAQRDGMPGVAFRWMEIEGPLYDESTTAGYKLLFGDLPMKAVESGTAGVALDLVATSAGGRRGRGGPAGRGSGEVSALKPTLVEVVSTNPEQDAERLLRAFMQRAYRRAPEERTVQNFLGVIKKRMEAGLGFAGSMLSGYTAVLASPQFVFVDEAPGRLDNHALATRLALFLWNSEPDAALRARADRGELTKPDVLKAEANRMLADPKSRRFVEAFLDYWIEIRKMEDTTPSTTLYNDYYLDDALTEAAWAETRLYFGEMLDKNLPARTVVDSDFTYLNDRLAAHYQIPGVDGIAMRRVKLPANSVRGGLMTQASVLKVTANGTTTSPVMRGKWIMERIVGQDLPLPPASVPAVEPDIRGAVTIRQQLDKHRADESCAMCHRKIDPPGFALESFDVLGGYRDRYRAAATDVAPEIGFGKNGWPYAFHYALPVDPSGQLADGRPFKDVRDFKKLLLTQETQIARNLVRQLSVFATGAPVRFSDRASIEQILAATKSSQYGVRSIVDQIIQSDLFLNK
jgi:hypothetical protein